jgi:hypothetical protein
LVGFRSPRRHCGQLSRSQRRWWFILAVMISPLLGILFVLVLPNLKHEALLNGLARRERPPPRASIGVKSTLVSVDRTPQPFEPDGVYAGVPYRVAPDGSIDAIMQGAMVRFRDFDKFTASIGATLRDFTGRCPVPISSNFRRHCPKKPHNLNALGFLPAPAPTLTINTVCVRHRPHLLRRGLVRVGCCISSSITMSST